MKSGHIKAWHSIDLPTVTQVSEKCGAILTPAELFAFSFHSFQMANYQFLWYFIRSKVFCKHMNGLSNTRVNPSPAVTVYTQVEASVKPNKMPPKLIK